MTRSWTRLALTLALWLLVSACQTAMSVEEAKKVVAGASDSLFVPPRTAADIASLLDQQARTEPEGVLREQADAAPPRGVDVAALAEFHYRRGLAAGQLGRAQQEIEDLTRALEYGRRAFSPLYVILHSLAQAEERGGDFARHVRHLREAIDAVMPFRLERDWQRIKLYFDLALGHAWLGELNEAEAALTAGADLFYKDLTKGISRGWLSTHKALYAQARAVLLDVTGNPAEAEALARSALALLTPGRSYSESTAPDTQHAILARTLIHQGRLLEAENEARSAVTGALAKRGRYSPHTAWMLRSLVWALREQGRYDESQRLARAVVDIYRKTRTPPVSLRYAVARTDLAMALELQGRHEEALTEYEAVRSDFRNDPAGLEDLFDGHLAGASVVSSYAEVLLQTGHVDRALELLGSALARSEELVGAPRSIAEIRATLARAYATKGESLRAVREFRAVTPLLLARAPDVDDEATRSRAADQRLVGVLSAYIRLLADIRGTAVEREAGIDAAAEAFRLADVARGRSVQRALSASAARAAARDPALVEVVRRQQDGRQQIAALYGLVANALGQPGEQDSRSVADLRARIATLRAALGTLTTRIEQEFPTYAELISPRPVTVDQVRAMLRPDEALIATLVAQDRTFVWAVPKQGPVVFAVAPMGAQKIAEAVARLRTALEPHATTLANVPHFDVALAHRLFNALLEPVRPGWADARSLLVVAHGPLGQLPVALLPTRAVTLPREPAAPFANYRTVPWLVRSHAVTVLPSVSSLVALRPDEPADANRRAFVGFGDPYFSREQASLAEAEKPRLADRIALVTRAVPLTFRNSPRGFDAAQLARLPRLSDTAEEIRELAQTMSADPERDVFLGSRANENRVKSLDLANYRVVAFATHGLVPGDLAGLTQPALALSAPEVAGVEGDGLLTLDEILALRLNADWIVLSACNTASGQGAGSEAVSGLGRAFFYAGARALLVSNWPVETTSARALTTDLFRRQQGNPGLSRAEALRQTMNWLIDRGEFVDGETGEPVFSYAHPIFWAPFTLVGDGGGESSR